MSKYQNTKTLLKDFLQVDVKTFLQLKKLKTQFHDYILLMILMVKKLLEPFMKNNCRKQFKKTLE